MNNKTLVFFGIGTYILSVLSSAEDLSGNSTAPVALIVVSAIATIVFTIMAAVRLWKIQKIASILLLASFAVTLVYISAPIKIFGFVIFLWAVSLLWAMAKREGLAKILQKDSGLTSEEFSSVQDDLRKDDHKSAEYRIAAAQERQVKRIKESTVLDVKDIILEIGKEISWADIVNHAFRVLEFDRNNTTIDQNNQVKAKSSFQPYGYLLSESPVLNNKVRIPIIHRDDFLLVASVFDEPKLAVMVVDEELLVTYAPKHLLPKGLSGSPHHVLHYAIAPIGTLDSYYSVNNDMHMAKPEPQKLFGLFVYQGEIKAEVPLKKQVPTHA